MGILERKEKQRDEIRKMILEASMQLFVKEGFENVSIRKIADLVEYSPTTLYIYFKDKNEILFHLCEMGFERMIASNLALVQIENPIDRLYLLGENYINFGLENPEYYDLMFIQNAPMKTIREQNCSILSTYQRSIANELYKFINEGNLLVYNKSKNSHLL